MSPLPLLLFAANFSFACGIILPLIQVERLFFFTDVPSLIGIVAGLWGNGDRTLALLIALFSVVFPALKLLLIHIAAYSRPPRPVIPASLRALSDWAMLDVVLVALVVFAAKTSGLATASTKPGLWFFAASASLTAGASTVAKRVQ